MPSGAARRLTAAVLPVAAVAFAWASLASPPRPVSFVAVAAATLLASLPSRLRSRVAVAVLVLLGLTVAVAGATPAAVREVVRRGAQDIYAVAPPFDAVAHPELHALVLLAAAGFGLGIAVTAGSRPFVAAAVTAGGVGWAATILPARNTVGMGALALLAALWPVVVGGVRDRRGLVPGAAVLAGVVVAATLVAGAGARPSVAAVDWKSWDLFGESRAGRTVALVWSSNYGGIEFPAAKTTVLRVTAPRRSLYWRATTLDSFAGDRWIESLRTTGSSDADGPLPRDPLLPAAAACRAAGWVKQEVEIQALVDDHVIAAAQPMEIAGDDDRRIRHPQRRHHAGGGRAPPDAALHGLELRPGAAPAVSSARRPVYPDSLSRYLDVGRTVVPPFGAPQRERPRLRRSSTTTATSRCGRTRGCGARPAA